MLLSVILCTHNPRADFLRRTLAALRQQTLALADWELLLIDNASSEPLEKAWDLRWHPQARVVREEALGLTPARLRGIAEAQSDLLVFVDDDNLLAPDFLATAARIARDWPVLGAWGGRIDPLFETPPPEWTKPHWIKLAIRQFDRDVWSNIPGSIEALPCGAGLCIRKDVARQYAQCARSDERRMALDRKGSAMSSCGDSDMALTARDIGLGTGLFTALKLEHIIPPSRLTREYLLKLTEAAHYSLLWLQSFRGGVPTLHRPTPIGRLLQALAVARMNPEARPFHQAMMRGIKRAARDLRDSQAGQRGS